MIAWARPFDGLRARVGLILLLHLVAVGFLIIFISADRGEQDTEMFRLVPAEEVLAMAIAVEATPPQARGKILRGLSTGFTLVTLGDDVPVDHTERADLRETIATYRAVLGGRPYHVEFPPDAKLTRIGPNRYFSAVPLRVRVRLNDGTVLMIERTTQPAVSIFMMRLPYILFAILIVGVLIVLLLAGQTTRPLSRLVRALRHGGASLSAPDLPIIGAREIRELSFAFNEMRYRLKELVEERTQFLAAVAHDYRTYLTRLELRADHIADRRQRVLAMADLGEMAALLDDTLTFARVSAGGDVETEAVTDICALVHKTLDIRADLVENVTLGDIPALRCDARIDPLAMQRILDNLVDNAVRYGGEARLSVCLRRGRIELRVDDDGPGVPEPDLKKLTRPFHRLEHSRARHTGGAGLGLAIVDVLVRQYGGTLELGSREGGGFRVSVALHPA